MQFKPWPCCVGFLVCILEFSGVVFFGADNRGLLIAAEGYNSIESIESPGLKAAYSVGSTIRTRVDPDILFAGSYDSHQRWQSDGRLPGQPFGVIWEGTLNVAEPGKYQFYFFGIGRFRFRLAEMELFEVDSSQLGWHTSREIDLPRGASQIRAEYSSSESQGAVGLYWSSNLFQLEPIESQWFSHSSNHPKNAQTDSQLLVRALRCQACHDFVEPDQQLKLPSNQKPIRGPSLVRAKDNLRSDWLVEHLSAKPDSVPAESTKQSPAHGDNARRMMPYFNLSKSDAQAIAAALMGSSSESKPAVNWSTELAALEKKRKSKEPPIRTQADVDSGEAAFVSLGCIACHSAGELGKVEDFSFLEFAFSGGDLQHTIRKRTSAAIARWLDDPSLVNSAHRMPRFDLSLHQRLDLHAWLTQLHPSDETSRNDQPMQVQPPSDEQIKRGVGLIRTQRCGACHELPESLASSIEKIAVRSTADWMRSCLSEGKQQQPRYVLPSRDVTALQNYLSGNDLPVAADDAGQIMAEHNCLSCHRRASSVGVSKHFATLAEDFPDLASRIPGMTPPALNAVGDKLHREAIELALGSKPERLREWLDIRMPQFDLSKDEISTLSNYFISHDRIPLGAPRVNGSTEVGTSVPAKDAVLHDQAYWLAAGRLVTPEGFSCQSCHQIGDSRPAGISLNAHGTDLTMVGRRVREDWFYRWVKNPTRIVPRMEMPAIQTAVTGVLGNSLDQQLHSLWLTLNKPDFRPPKPNPVRILRGYNDGQPEFTQVLTDVIEVPAVITRPLVIGFPNRNNWLIDLENGSLRGWWLGDLARLHTRGKSWYWEPGAEPLVKCDYLEAWYVEDKDLGLLQPTAPEDQQFAFELDQLQHTAQGIVFKGRLHIANSQAQSQQILRVQQAWSWRDNQQCKTEITVEGLKSNQSLIIKPVGKVATVEASNQTQPSIRADLQNGHRFEYQTSAEIRVKENGIHLSPASADQPVHVIRVMHSAVVADRVSRVNMPKPERVAKQLDCVPGFEALELPLPRTEMPISIAWDLRGRCYVGSLKGRVLEVVDTDSDGLWDDYQRISDEIPTPYGLFVGNEGIDVLAKYGLLRLTPAQGGVPVMDFQVVADGWGYTPDYHDWAVGLERDGGGNYYITLPCQQDDRSPAAARWRGHALRLEPISAANLSDNESRIDSDRLYRVQPIAGGLRFPMGVALNRQGDLFASDNQGNYTPFNELNHLRSGKRYGFINKLEIRPGFSPPFESPAINIPHPWMRSVNGICFLDSPMQSDRKAVFGPFEGHLIGCEMNGRCLVRMSLERVAGQYQGAVYPFSLPIGVANENFEGPIVCKVAPNGDLYIGNLHDSGWGGGNNTGSLVRLRPLGDWPLGIAEVRATTNGFTVAFTQSVDPIAAADKLNYSVRSYTRTPTPAYGGDDQDEKIEAIQTVNYDSRTKIATIQLSKLREGAVYEINIKAIGPEGKELFPDQCHYTMRAVPQ